MSYRALTALLCTSSLLMLSTMLSGCAFPIGMAAGAAATAGVAASKEGGLKSAVSDTAIKAKINDKWFRHDVDMFTKLTLTVENGRVLITGVVQRPEERVEAVRLAWEVAGVKQLINEIQIGEPKTFTSLANDKWISGQLRTRLVLDPDIQSINYTIDTVKGIVYLMGVAQSQDELERVVRVARRIQGVKQVVSYVKMVGEAIIPNSPNSSINSKSPTQLTDSSSITTSEENMVAVPLTPRKDSIEMEPLSP